MVGAVFAITLTLAMRSDSRQAGDSIRLAFLGRLTQEEDAGFHRFSKAFERLPASLRNRVNIQFASTKLGAVEDIEKAVDAALAGDPTVIVAPSTFTAAAVRRRNRDIPVIFASFLDPVRYAVVSSTSARSEPFTGVWIDDDLDAKRLEVLRDAYPAVKKVAVLMDADWRANTKADTRLIEAGQRLGLEVSVLSAETLVEANRLLDETASNHFDAWCLPPTGLAFLHLSAIMERLRSWRRPVVVGNTAAVEQGAPLSLALDYSFTWPAMIDLLGRVLNGESAAAIPVQRTERAVLAVRPKPAEGFPPPASPVTRHADVVYR
ncbi:hypothetical protein ASD88_02050 [Pelomonas sp. Root662]|nr:hypothetical protein ASC81_02050 [Pelomonas sp. Root405]KRA77680.1 hypothetical protein ASD88_02050 [Pelomonas sp. Root662]